MQIIMMQTFEFKNLETSHIEVSADANEVTFQN